MLRPLVLLEQQLSPKLPKNFACDLVLAMTLVVVEVAVASCCATTCSALVSAVLEEVAPDASFVGVMVAGCFAHAQLGRLSAAAAAVVVVACVKPLPNVLAWSFVAAVIAQTEPMVASAARLVAHGLLERALDVVLE